MHCTCFVSYSQFQVFTKNKIFAVVDVKRALQLQYPRTGLLQKVLADRLNRKTDLGRPSFQFEVGFSTAIFQALNYLADPHSKFASFIIHVHRTVLLYISVIIQWSFAPYTRLILLEQEPCLILLTLVTSNITYLVNEFMHSLTVHLTSLLFKYSTWQEVILPPLLPKFHAFFCSAGAINIMIPK